MRTRFPQQWQSLRCVDARVPSLPPPHPAPSPSRVADDTLNVALTLVGRPPGALVFAVSAAEAARLCAAPLRVKGVDLRVRALAADEALLEATFEATVEGASGPRRAAGGRERARVAA